MEKIFDKFFENEFGIIFGILSGTGLVVLLTSFFSLIKNLLEISEPYSSIIYAILFIFVFIGVLIRYPEGWLRIFYSLSALILFIMQMFVKLGVLN